MRKYIGIRYAAVALGMLLLFQANGTCVVAADQAAIDAQAAADAAAAQAAADAAAQQQAPPPAQ